MPRISWDPKVTLGNVLTVVALLVTLIGGYVNLKVELANAGQQIEAVQDQVEALDRDNLPTRMTVLENQIVTSRAQRDKQLDQMTDKLDRMEASIVALSNAVAGLTATLKATEARRP